MDGPLKHLVYTHSPALLHLEYFEQHGINDQTCLHAHTCLVGMMPDASVGEAAHQQHKGCNKSSSGRDQPAHYIRHANTCFGLSGLACGIPYLVTKFDKSAKRRVVVQVRPGAGCSRVLRTLLQASPSATERSVGLLEAALPTSAESSGQHPGGALWRARLWETGDAAHNHGDWKECVATSRLRPDEETLLEAYNTFYGCGRLGGADVCAEPRCPVCWATPPLLNKKTVRCSRYKHGASRKASSGLGRWRGGDARAAAASGPQHAWALGEGAGEYVEIHTTREPSGGYNEDPGTLTIGRVICFFDHKGNKCPGVATRPQTSWVLVHDYVTRGPGIQRDTDACTQHPILVLRGRGRPLIYPVSAIRRHVHLYHVCSVAKEGVHNLWTCGPMMTKTKGGGVAEV